MACSMLKPTILSSQVCHIILLMMASSIAGNAKDQVLSVGLKASNFAVTYSTSPL